MNISYPEEARRFFRVRFNELLKAWKNAEPECRRTNADFAEAVNAVTKGGKCRFQTVSKWSNGPDFPTAKYMDGICTVLGVDSSVFFPQTHDELYENDQPFNEEISRTLAEYCKKIGLSLHFLTWITSTDGFADTFPFYSPLTLRSLYSSFAVSTFDYEYSRMNLARAKAVDDPFHIQAKGRTVILNRADLQFLKTIQDSLSGKLNPFYFAPRKTEMENEEEAANKELYKETSEGWRSEIPLPWEKLLAIDTYMKYVTEEDDDDGKT